MKVALIQANIGSIDDVPAIPKQSSEYHYYLFTENNLPYPLPNFDNRTKARYLKMMPHRYLPGYDIYIWLDARVQVISDDFIKNYLDLIRGQDFVCTLHGYRGNIYDELKFILHEMNKGNHYLIRRYGHQSLRKELDFYYKEDFPKEFPLFSSGMFCRVNSSEVNACCDEWFMRSLEFTNFDQAMLSYCMYNHKLKYKTVNYENEFYKVLKHKHEPY